jgi:hypothetical protein
LQVELYSVRRDAALTLDGVEDADAKGRTTTGTGVLGANEGNTGIGVHGLTGGVGSAVSGEATANGVGVFGKSQTGAALRGDSTNGTALQVNGKATFSRSGTVTVAAGTASKTVTLAGVTAAAWWSQPPSRTAPCSSRRPSRPAARSRSLNGTASGSGLKVAYFVLN